MRLPDGLIALLHQPSQCFVATVMPDGSPQMTQTWVDTDGEHVIINTVQGFQKVKNVERDPRATVTIIVADNPYSYAEVRGTVVEIVRGDEARAHIDALSQKYVGRPYQAEIQSERVILKIAALRQLTRL